MDKVTQKKQVLMGGTFVYFVGNVLTQLISLLLLKLITGNISTDAYGYFNLVVTIDNLVTPMLTLQISDAVFRFLIKSSSDEEKRQWYSTGLAVIAAGAALTCLIIFFLSYYINIPLAPLVAAYIISTNVFSFSQKVARAFGKSKNYVVGNLVKSILYILLQLLFVVKLNAGVKGLFLANILSTASCIALIVISTGTYRFFRIASMKINAFLEMVKFSAPLIPNTAVWWLQSSINAILISSVLGVAENGIYAIANKFSCLLNLVITVFALAWQESAIREYGTPEYKQFATESFNTYITLLFSGVAVLIPCLKIVMPYIISIDYYGAIQYTPFLLYATALSAFSGFFSSIIIAKNQNKKLLSTNLLGSITNILIVFCLIRVIGIWAIVVSAIVTNLVLVVSQYGVVKDTIDQGRVDILKIGLLLFCGVISCVVFFSCPNLVNILLFVAFAVVAILVNIGFIMEAVKYIKIKVGKP